VPELRDLGIKKTRTALKLVVSTGEFDSRLLEQGGIESLKLMKERLRSANRMDPSSTLKPPVSNQGVQSQLSSTPADQEDWYTGRFGWKSA